MLMVPKYKSILFGSKLTQNMNDHYLDSKLMNLLLLTANEYYPKLQSLYIIYTFTFLSCVPIFLAMPCKL